jgi:RNA polymerase sigma-70 factor (ECF subfamily)
MSHLAAGNHDALAVIFDRYQRLVIRVTMQILRDAAEAEDIMQSVFMAVLETARKFDAARGTLRVWILQHAYHQALNRRRYLSVRGMYDAWPDDGTNRATLDSCGAMQAQEREHLVRQALRQVNRRQRETLELAFYYGLTMQEIADRTGQPYANIRHYYYRGLEKLRHVLNGGQPSERPSSATGEERAYVRS